MFGRQRHRAYVGEACSQAGMLETGTNTELAKTSGKITTKPADCAASAPRTVSATKREDPAQRKAERADDRDRGERLQQLRRGSESRSGSRRRSSAR